MVTLPSLKGKLWMPGDKRTGTPPGLVVQAGDADDDDNDMATLV